MPHQKIIQMRPCFSLYRLFEFFSNFWYAPFSSSIKHCVYYYSDVLIHRKFIHESIFQHFTNSCFTSVLCSEFLFTLDSRDFSNFMWNHIEIDRYFTQNQEKWGNRHSGISRFTQMVRNEITFTLNSRKFYLRPITILNPYPH